MILMLPNQQALPVLQCPSSACIYTPPSKTVSRYPSSVPAAPQPPVQRVATASLPVSLRLVAPPCHLAYLVQPQ